MGLGLSSTRFGTAGTPVCTAATGSGWAGGGAHQREARLVERKGLSCLQHDVARIVRLGNPDGAFETLDREPLPIVDIKQFAGFQASGAVNKMSCHVPFLA